MLDAQTDLGVQSAMETERKGFENDWREAAELFLPRQADFFDGIGRQQGANRANRIYDSYGTQAAGDGVSVFEGYVMPKGSLWQLLVPPVDRPELAKLQHVAEWFERKTNRLHQYRNNARSGFATETNESSASLMVMGNQGMETAPLHDPMLRRPVGIRYRSEFLGRLYWREDWQGQPERRHVKFIYTAEQALGRFGRDALKKAPQVLTAATGTAAQKAKPFEWLRVIVPNPNIDHGRLDWRGKPWVQGIMSIADKSYVEIGGYRAPPITVSRFAKSPTETYGRGPGTDTLPDCKAAQAIFIDLMVGAEMALRPPLGATDDAKDMLISYAAATISYGAIDPRGNRLVQELMKIDPAAAEFALKIQAQIHATMDRAFFRHLLLMSQDLKSHVNDSQLYERQQEKGVLLSPLSRQETEWFTPMLDSEIGIMADLGDFNDMPAEVREAGGAKGVIYDNPLNRALKAEQAGGAYRALDKIVSLAQYVGREPIDAFFREVPLAKMIPNILDIEAVPASWRATDAEKKAADETKAARDQLEQMKALAETAKPAGQAAREFSQATANA